MDRKPRKSGPAQDADSREARLKAALKANLARRKAQARAKAAAAETGGAAQPGRDNKN